MTDCPQLQNEQFQALDENRLFAQKTNAEPIKILVLYGSLRPQSFSRRTAEEGAHILEKLGAEVRFYNPSGLPLVDDNVDASHPKVAELRDLVTWCDGMVWSSPERHGAMTGIMKTQIDWIPLSLGSVRPTQGKTLALMQVSGGSQSLSLIHI